MTSKQQFKVNLLIGLGSLGIILLGIAVEAIWPLQVKPVEGKINSLIFTAGMVLGGLVRHVLPSVSPIQEPKEGISPESASTQTKS